MQYQCLLLFYVPNSNILLNVHAWKKKKKPSPLTDPVSCHRVEFMQFSLLLFQICTMEEMAKPAHLFVKNVAVPFFAAGVIVSTVAGSKAGHAVVVLLFKDEVLEVLGDSGGSDTLGDDRGTVLNSP